MIKSSYRSEIWQVCRQNRCRCSCQISERSNNTEPTSPGFETSQNLVVRRLTTWFDAPSRSLWRHCNGKPRVKCVKHTKYVRILIYPRVYHGIQPLLWHRFYIREFTTVSNALRACICKCIYLHICLHIIYIFGNSKHILWLIWLNDIQVLHVCWESMR